MTEADSKKLIAWGHMNTATYLMHTAVGMIFSALWESNNSGDLIGVNDRLKKLMSEAKKLTTDMQNDTNKLFQNPLDDEKPTTAE